MEQSMSAYVKNKTEVLGKKKVTSRQRREVELDRIGDLTCGYIPAANIGEVSKGSR